MLYILPLEFSSVSKNAFSSRKYTSYIASLKFAIFINRLNFLAASKHKTKQTPIYILYIRAKARLTPQGVSYEIASIAYFDFARIQGPYL